MLFNVFMCVDMDLKTRDFTTTFKHSMLIQQCSTMRAAPTLRSDQLQLTNVEVGDSYSLENTSRQQSELDTKALVSATAILCDQKLTFEQEGRIII